MKRSQAFPRSRARRNPSADARRVMQLVVKDLMDQRNDEIVDWVTENPEWAYATAERLLAEYAPGGLPSASAHPPAVPSSRAPRASQDNGAEVSQLRTKLFSVIAELSE